MLSNGQVMNTRNYQWTLLQSGVEGLYKSIGENLEIICASICKEKIKNLKWLAITVFNHSSIRKISNDT